jgi:hypothetical protein
LNGHEKDRDFLNQVISTHFEDTRIHQEVAAIPARRTGRTQRPFDSGAKFLARLAVPLRDISALRDAG